MDYKKVLLEKINNLINGIWTLPKFEEEYYQYFLNEVPDDSLTTTEMEFFGLVQEKLDWTAPTPSLEEKQDGYIDHQGYTEWLKNNTQDFINNEEVWYANYLNSFKK